MDYVSLVGEELIQSQPVVSRHLHAECHGLRIGPAHALEGPKKPVGAGAGVGDRHGENFFTLGVKDTCFVLFLSDVDTAEIHHDHLLDA